MSCEFIHRQSLSCYYWVVCLSASACIAVADADAKKENIGGDDVEKEYIGGDDVDVGTSSKDDSTNSKGGGHA